MTMAQIARLAGVSRTAVSAVLNKRQGTTRLKPETRQRIETLLRQTRYRPSSVGKALVLRRSLLVGVMAQEVGWSFMPQALQGIEDFAEDRGCGVLVMTGRHEPQREERVLEFLLERRTDGIILAPLSGMSSRMRELLIEKKTPIVYLFHEPADPLPGARAVRVDEVRLGQLAVQHLLEKGHRHIACIGMPPEIRQGIDLAAQAVPDAAVEHWEWETPRPEAPPGFHRWRQADPQPTAVFVRGDEHACAFMNLALRFGFKVPDDLAIIGVDDLPPARDAVVPMTTISQPKYEQGFQAAKLLFDLMDGKPRNNVILKPELVPRQST